MTSERLVGGVRYAIVLGEKRTALEGVAAEDLSHYIGRMVDMRARVYRGVSDLSAIEEDAVFVIGSPDTNAVVGRLTQASEGRLDLRDLGDQGYAVQSTEIDGKVVVALAGNSPLGAMYATSTYLESSCGVGFFNDGDRVPQLVSLPTMGLSYSSVPHFEHRSWLHHAVWTKPYDRCIQLWKFEDWQKLIDWMRRKKLNLLSVFHDEGTFLWGDAIFRAFPRIPKNRRTLHHFTMMPDYRTELNQQIFRYARANGVHIAYNLFYSQVPDFFQEFYPELEYHQLQMGNLGICASQPECQDTMLRYWGEILEELGTDDSHTYYVCPYQHEARLCDKFENRVEPTRQAYEVLKQLDPAANMYVETWCWVYNQVGEARFDPELAKREWADFQKVLPSEVGVADWDRVVRTWRTKTPGENYDWYKGRKWVSLHHLTMEMAWPPDFGWHPLKHTVKAIRTAVEHDAYGLSTFHILARTNELPSYVFAEMAWNPDLTQDEMIRSFLKLRFRPESVDVLEKSLEANFEAVTEDAWLLAMKGYGCLGAETGLVEMIKADGRKKTDAWIAERLEDFEYRFIRAKEALALAEQVEANEEGNSFYEHFLWELKYLVNRWYGVIEFYKAYRSNETVISAGEHFHHALAALYRIREMFRDDKGIRMEALKELAPEVKYNPSFLADWKNTFWRETNPKAVRYHNVVWEHFPEYEAKLASMNPELFEEED